MADMEQPELATSEAATEDGAEPRDWWHRDHPTFTALSGFFSGMLFVTAVPGAFAALLRLLLPYERAEELFPLVLLTLIVPLGLLAYKPTRRFAGYLLIGMVLTALVVLGVASLVLYFMVQLDG